MKKKTFIQLLKKYNEGKASEAEQKFVELYYELLHSASHTSDQLREEDSYHVKQKILNEILQKIQPVNGTEEKKDKAKIKGWIWPVQVAAAVVVLLTAAIFIQVMIASHKKKLENIVAKTTVLPYVNQIHPGGNKAVLTLANGTQIDLDSVQKGALVKQGNTKIIKINSGLLAYNDNQQMANNAQKEIQYNTITTPRGGQYVVILVDGTKVWLNAASSLRYPTAFTGKERVVEMQGEVYFEVAKNAKMPFVVKTGDARIKVFGTHFNVNAYENENTIRTTLAEGSVQVTDKNRNVLLKPGEQAKLDKQTGNIDLLKANVDEVLAWKNNLFYFDNTNIKAIMIDLSRWYDVDIIYKTEKLDNKNYSGIISRYSDVNAVLERLSLTGTVHFKIEGPLITVTD
ncbi:MAG TPA: FecR domain-containing protein [Hanamia sp.]